LSFADLIQKKSGAGGGFDASPEAGLPEPSRAGSLEPFLQRFGHVTEEYLFYNDEITLRFNTEEHRYYRVGELGNLIPVNGVTNTVGIIDKSHMLTPWAAKMAIQKLLRIMPTEMVEGVIRIKPLTFEEFTVIALEAKGAHKEKLDEAGDIGHLAHKCLEDSILYAMANDPEKIVRQLINIPTDELAANAASGGFNWMQAHNVRWEETETKIYSREFDYAGTMDGLATCDSCNDKACCPESFKDRLSLIDWKSSNHLKIEYLFQTASYKHAKMEMRPDLNILDTWILRLGKSEEEAGKFEPWHMTPDEYEEDFQGFLACLRLTRLVDSVEERMKSQKSTIRAIKKEQRETAKAIKKEQEKLQKALDKAAAKKARDEEKARIKEEAKLKREETKAAKKAGIKPGSVRAKYEGVWHVTQPGEPLFSTALFAAEEVYLDTGWEPIVKENECTSAESAQDTQMALPEATKLGSTVPLEASTLKTTSTSKTTPALEQQKTQPECLSTTSTEEIKCTSTLNPNPDSSPLVTIPQQPASETLSSSPSPTGPTESKLENKSTISTVVVLTVAPVPNAVQSLQYESEAEYVSPIRIPMEG
jgi:hypothetical protein